MTVLFALLLLHQQEKPPPQPIKDWTFHQKEINPKTGKEEVALFVEGLEAIPIDLKKEIFEVKGVKATYFTEPDKDRKSEKIIIRAGRGRLDNAAKRLDLSHDVRIERPAPEGSGVESSVVEAPAAVVYTEKENKKLFVEKRFRLSDPMGRLAGDQVTADLNKALRETTVPRNGFLEMIGRASDLADPGRQRSRPPRRVITQIYAEGPLTVKEPQDRSLPLEIAARDKVRLDRLDEAGTATVTADEADIFAFRRLDPVTGRTTIQPERLRAKGNVNASAVMFADGNGLDARADTLDWRMTDHVDWVEDVAVLTGAPLVDFRSGPYRISSKKATIERLTGLATFEDDVKADLVPGKGAKPLKLSSHRVVAHAVAGGAEIQDIEATGGVVLEGLGEKGGRGEADRFFWNLSEQRGFLEKRPLVRVVQDGSIILASLIVLEGTSVIVLKGPKLVRILQPAEDGNVAEYRVTSEGDVDLNTAGEKTTIRIRDRCSIRTQDFHVHADRVDVRMSADGKKVEQMRASGNVRARQLKEGAMIYGERLEYDPTTGALSLFGRPDVVADAGSRVATQRQLIFTEETDPKTGRKVKYTRMVGGDQGIRIVIDEKEP